MKKNSLRDMKCRVKDENFTYHAARQSFAPTGLEVAPQVVALTASQTWQLA
jgi:hypothetical protein